MNATPCVPTYFLATTHTIKIFISYKNKWLKIFGYSKDFKINNALLVEVLFFFSTDHHMLGQANITCLNINDNTLLYY